MFHLRQQWMPAWLAVPLLAGYAAGAMLLYRAAQSPGEYGRIPIPAYGLLAALLIPAAVNARRIRAGREGVQVTNGPIARGRKLWVARRDIRACTIRTQYAHFDGDTTSDRPPVPNYLVGIETRNGEQIDIAYPYLTIEQAETVADQLAAALNEDRTQPRIAVESARYAPASAGKRMWKVLCWGAAFIAAVVLGAVWEVAR